MAEVLDNQEQLQEPLSEEELADLMADYQREMAALESQGTVSGALPPVEHASITDTAISDAESPAAGGVGAEPGSALDFNDEDFSDPLGADPEFGWPDEPEETGSDERIIIPEEGVSEKSPSRTVKPDDIAEIQREISASLQEEGIPNLDLAPRIAVSALNILQAYYARTNPDKDLQELLPGDNSLDVAARVIEHLKEPEMDLAHTHDMWVRDRKAEGYLRGEMNEDERTHPDLLRYEELPAEKRQADTLFATIVRALSDMKAGLNSLAMSDDATLKDSQSLTAVDALVGEAVYRVMRSVQANDRPGAAVPFSELGVSEQQHYTTLARHSLAAASADEIFGEVGASEALAFEVAKSANTVLTSFKDTLREGIRVSFEHAPTNGGPDINQAPKQPEEPPTALSRSTEHAKRKIPTLFTTQKAVSNALFNTSHYRDLLFAEWSKIKPFSKNRKIPNQEITKEHIYRGIEQKIQTDDVFRTQMIAMLIEKDPKSMPRAAFKKAPVGSAEERLNMIETIRAHPALKELTETMARKVKFAHHDLKGTAIRPKMNAECWAAFAFQAHQATDYMGMSALEFRAHLHRHQNTYQQAINQAHKGYPFMSRVLALSATAVAALNPSTVALVGASAMCTNMLRKTPLGKTLVKSFTEGLGSSEAVSKIQKMISKPGLSTGQKNPFNECGLLDSIRDGREYSPLKNQEEHTKPERVEPKGREKGPSL